MVRSLIHFHYGIIRYITIAKFWYLKEEKKRKGKKKKKKIKKKEKKKKKGKERGEKKERNGLDGKRADQVRH